MNPFQARLLSRVGAVLRIGIVAILGRLRLGGNVSLRGVQIGLRGAYVRIRVAFSRINARKKSRPIKAAML